MWYSSQHIVSVWLTKNLLDSMLREAKAHSPNETGGVLAGYSDQSSSNFRIEYVVGPGPDSIHTPYSFIPDHMYQEQEIARLYRESGRISTYLGDWHSHPGSGLYLSSTDRKTLSRIALSEDARIYRPLMAIVGGPNWELAIWQGVTSSYRLLPPILKTNPCEIKVLPFS
jgi:integrative and conjugative element protein (TIGR02256 family)